jgi:hypothetical protein
MVAALCKIARPDAFYVRLLNPGHPKFASVESFFRDVVDPIVEDIKSSKIPSKFKEKSRHTHNALDDAIEQAEMFQRMRERAAGKG